jgi:hypothetical protein
MILPAPLARIRENGKVLRKFKHDSLLEPRPPAGKALPRNKPDGNPSSAAELGSPPFGYVTEPLEIGTNLTFAE